MARDGAEPHRGMGRRAGLVGPIGSAARGWRDHITERSSPVSRSVRSSPSVRSVMSRHGHLPTCAGIGRTRTGNAGTGTIAIRSVRPNNNGTPSFTRVAYPYSHPPTTIAHLSLEVAAGTEANCCGRGQVSRGRSWRRGRRHRLQGQAAVERQLPSARTACQSLPPPSTLPFRRSPSSRLPRRHAGPRRGASHHPGPGHVEREDEQRPGAAANSRGRLAESAEFST